MSTRGALDWPATDAVPARRRRLPASARRALVALPAAAALAAFSLVLASWPATAGLVVAVGVIALLAVRAPSAALAAAVVLLAFEGVVKLLLRLEPTPLSDDARAVGAAGIDLALVLALAGLVAADRGAFVAGVWRRSSRPERALMALLPAFLALSAAQVALGDDVGRGLEGFRLFHAYVPMLIGGGIVFWQAPAHRRAVAAVGIVLAVAAYGALRVVVEPGGSELDLITSAGGTEAYGGEVRAVGSFSGAVGMASFLVPAVVFAALLGTLTARARALCWAAAALGVVALVASYARAPLVALAVGLGVAVLVVATAGGVPRRTKVLAAVALVGVAVAGFGGLALASNGSWALSQRTAVLTDPLSDRAWSLSPRLERWDELSGDAVRHPLGQGIGRIGGATREAGTATADSSYVKVLVEQGPVGALVFVVGLLGLVAIMARRLRRADGELRGVGIAALGGFVAFLVLATTGETVEQPGKVAAWALAGIALAAAFGSGGRARAPGDSVRRTPRMRRPAWAAVVLLLAAGSALMAASRQRDHTASMEIAPRALGPLPAVRDPAAYPWLLLDPPAWRAVLENPRFPGLEFSDIRAAGTPRGTLALSATRPTPREALELLRVAAPRLVAASERDAAAAAWHRAMVVFSRLRAGKTPAPARSALRRELRGLGAVLERPRARFTLGAPAAPPESTRAADRAAAALPGPLPARPSPFLAALAGALAGGLLWLGAWAHGRPPRRRGAAREAPTGIEPV
jgi:hypothetical protein